MPRILRTPWTSQPQVPVRIDWSNPMTKGLIDVMIAANLRSVKGVVATTSGTVTSGVGSYGRLRKTPSGGDNKDIYAGAWSRIPAPLTLVAMYRIVAATSYTRIAGNLYTSSYGYGLGPSTTNFRAIVSRSGVNTILTGAPISSARKVDALIVDTTNCYLYENGRLTAGPTVHGGMATPTGDFSIGAENSPTIAPTDEAEYYLTGLWNRCLSASEVKSLSDNPWQIFEPENCPLFFDFGAAAGGDTNISASLGTASASGYSATVDRQRTIAASLGTATAQGYAATVNRSRDIAASLGTAAASGYSATINRQRDIAASLGTATAQGYGASISFSNDINIAASLGLASADGYQANVNLQRDIAASLGAAVAQGYSASISDTDPLHGFTQGQLDFLVAHLEANMAIPTAEQIAIAVRFELASELTRISDLAKRGGVVSGTPVVIPPGDGSIVAGDVEIGVSTSEDGTVTLARV